MEGEESTEVIVREPEMEYPSNSYSKRAEQTSEPHEEKESKMPAVAHGRAVTRKKSFWERLKGWVFVDAEDYEDYIYEDFIRPAITDAAGDLAHNVFDTVLDGIDTALFGDGGRARRRSRSGYWRGYDDYDEYWNRERRGRRRSESRSRDRDDDRRYSRRSDEVAAIVESREEARNLIDAMQSRVHKFKCASVLNFYDAADMPTKPADDNYGWDLGHPFEATVTRTRDGYIVEPVSPIWLDR